MTRTIGGVRCRASATSKARIVIVGLAPGAHGANRTGRVFTGDRSGDFLYAALHRRGLASQANSIARSDGLSLTDVFITCPVRCVPPDNRPSPGEIETCAPFFTRELSALGRARVLLALGSIGWKACLDHSLARASGAETSGRSSPTGPKCALGRIAVLGSYHVSQQNTQTGRLTRRDVRRGAGTRAMVLSATDPVDT